jgi:hypothetical protein
MNKPASLAENMPPDILRKLAGNHWKENCSILQNFCKLQTAFAKCMKNV